MEGLKTIIETLFMVRDTAHVAHLSSKSFAKHVALDSYYSDLLDKIDELTETAQGQYGILKNLSFTSKRGISDSNITNFLRNFIEAFIKQYKETFKNDTHLMNICDEIVGITYRTIYKLENLS